MEPEANCWDMSEWQRGDWVERWVLGWQTSLRLYDALQCVNDGKDVNSVGESWNFRGTTVIAYSGSVSKQLPRWRIRSGNRGASERILSFPTRLSRLDMFTS